MEGGAAAWVAGFWQHQVLGGVGGQGSRKCSALEGDGNQYWPIHASILAWRPLFPDEKPGRHSLQGYKELDPTKATLHA